MRIHEHLQREFALCFNWLCHLALSLLLLNGQFRRQILRDVFFIGSGDCRSASSIVYRRCHCWSLVVGIPSFVKKFIEMGLLALTCLLLRSRRCRNGWKLREIKGKRSSGDEGCGGRTKRPSICIFQEELEGQDFIFRTNIDEDFYRLF